MLSFQIKPAAALMAELLNVLTRNYRDSSSGVGACAVYTNMFIDFHMTYIGATTGLSRCRSTKK